MPPKQSAATGSKPRGRPPSKTGTKKSDGDAVAKKGSAARKSAGRTVDEDEPEDGEPTRADNSSDVEMVSTRDKDNDQNVDEFASDGEDEQPKRIPPELLRRLLHEAFDRDTTRVSKEANAAVARYFDIFVQEAIARTAAERNGRFLEVEDLEKVAPQLLLDL
ncbi:hypothetical protein PspLS_06061 [Pyricularia sp. CBS 133598]|nr:hypothetical protein PspLS_06061 [Pyricularia sp. CBS 133598]